MLFYDIFVNVYLYIIIKISVKNTTLSCNWEEEVIGYKRERERERENTGN